MPGQWALGMHAWKQEEVLGHRHRKMFQLFKVARLSVRAAISLQTEKVQLCICKNPCGQYLMKRPYWCTTKGGVYGKVQAPAIMFLQV